MEILGDDSESYRAIVSRTKNNATARKLVDDVVQYSYGVILLISINLISIFVNPLVFVFWVFFSILILFNLPRLGFGSDTGFGIREDLAQIRHLGL